MFHAGTTIREEEVVTNGGRVLTVVACGKTFNEAISSVYRAVGQIKFPGIHYRTDIGKKALLALDSVASSGGL